MDADLEYMCDEKDSFIYFLRRKRSWGNKSKVLPWILVTYLLLPLILHLEAIGKCWPFHCSILFRNCAGICKLQNLKNNDL